jgi:hypothetical protein
MRKRSSYLREKNREKAARAEAELDGIEPPEPTVPGPQLQPTLDMEESTAYRFPTYTLVPGMGLLAQ